MKLCECGCGSPAPLAISTDISRGRTKGLPLKFIHGHNGRIQRPEKHFWTFVNKNGPMHPTKPHLGCCWEWMGSLNERGYGSVRFQNITKKAHRVAYFLRHGQWPRSGCHSCDNRKCCRPSHLWDCTQEENLKDAAAKGRMPGRPMR
jgi:HNH endonuclease